MAVVPFEPPLGLDGRVGRLGLRAVLAVVGPKEPERIVDVPHTLEDRGRHLLDMLVGAEPMTSHSRTASFAPFITSSRCLDIM